MDGKKLWIFLVAQTAVFAILLIALGVILLRQGNRNEEARNQLVEEIRSNSEAIETVRSGLLRMAEDTGQVRESLMLPRRDYSFLREEPADGQGGDEPNPFAPYFAALQELIRYNETNRSYAALESLLSEEPVRSFFSRVGIRFEDTDAGAYRLFRGQESLGRLEAGADAEEYLLHLPAGESVTLGSSAELLNELEDVVEALERRESVVEEALTTLRRFAASQEARDLLESYALRAGSVTEGGDGEVTLPIIKGRSAAIFSISAGPGIAGYAIDGGEPVPEEELLASLDEYLSEADLRTNQEAAVDERVEELRTLFADPGFQGYLDQLGLQVEDEPREGEEYLYFELRRKDGTLAGSLAVQRLNAAVWVMDEDDVPLTSLRRLNGGAGRETSSRELDREIPEISGILSTEGQETYLVIGSHETMADTVILSHVNHQEKTIQLISVPRDLYYRGRKINVLYPNYGGHRFAEELSEITGLQIAGYVAIDMYAFIDAVNIVGGISVTLEEALIDPTYRTKENGRWSTLYYPAGTHQLSGIEALRLARSRHADSDFGRAERQQAILASLKEELSSLGAGNMGTLYELLSTLSRYVDTDLSVYEMARLANQARSYEITRQIVLNTDNILYHTYSNLYYSGKSAEEVDEDFYKGAWILLPKEDNWDAIRWFIRDALGEEAA